MTVQLWCSDGVFLAQVREDIIVLDVNADSYACLVDAAGWLSVKADGSLEVADDATALALVAPGLAQMDPPVRPRRVAAPPSRELTPCPAVSTAEILRAGVRMAVATLAFRGRPFPLLIRSAQPSRSRRLPLDSLRLGRSVAAFRGALPWLPLEGECLQRSFQLRRLLFAHGVQADWIFGVRTWPFAAHCWLQIGDMVVGDSLARVKGYTPIMAA